MQLCVIIQKIDVWLKLEKGPFIPLPNSLNITCRVFYEIRPTLAYYTRVLPSIAPGQHKPIATEDNLFQNGWYRFAGDA